MSTERIQKILAQVGIASRRKAEALIADGLVTVNGKVAKLGDKANIGKDAIKVKGKLIHQSTSLVYMAFYKPKGVISALSDPEDRATLSEFLKAVKTRVYPVGRLDFSSEGLILLTNDGEFAEKIQKGDEIPRVYQVKVKGHPDAEMLTRLERGARIGDKKRLFKPFSVSLKKELNNKAMVQVVVMGKGAFDLKAYFEMKGFLVERICRTAIGHISLKGISIGQFRYLKASQAYALLEQPELGLKLIEDQEHLIPRTKVVIAPNKSPVIPNRPIAKRSALKRSINN